jgi:Protein of unknown function (DUF1553)/Protein of unknown function (DUF1549)/Planctomycete cytochrome C
MPSLRLVAIALVCVVPSLRAADDPKAVEFFESKIRPVLVEKCVKCHSDKADEAGKLRGGLKLDSRVGIEKGGETGAAVVAGKPNEGTVLKSLRYDGEIQMPPDGKLPANVIADFEKWIKDGAVDPRDGTIAKKAAGIDLEKGRQFWSFQPPKAVEVPAGRNPIDHFIQAKWSETGLQPTAMADRRTLIRRASFDLVGLPPTPEEVEAFVNDSSPDAWPKLIDRLLASPRHGERWARHWLDVARYSEDQAHTFAVTPKKNAYLYRDWVIKAFNDDMPYDRFVKLQIAGDLMPESAGDKFTRLAGLGLMGLGAEYYKNTAREQAIAEELDDRVDTLTRGFLGLTVACARCHDHKFDPIPTRDYYSIAGIYNGSAFTSAPLVPDADVKAYDEAQSKVKAAEAAVNSFLGESGKAAAKAAVALTAKYLAAAWEARSKKEKLSDLAKRDGLNCYFLDRWVKFLDPSNAGKAPAQFKDWFGLKSDATTKDVQSMAEAIQSKLIAVELPNTLPMKGSKGGNKNADPLTKAMFLDANAPLFVSPADAEKLFLAEDAKPKLAEMRTEVEKQKKASPPAPLTAHVVSGGGQTMSVYIRGNPATKGETAPKRFLQVISTNAPASEFTRLDLANSIASEKNPLTARVIVNRVWAWHFGRGLVNTPSNFGALGDRPSHPELLDTLTVEFVKNGWSLKWLHRQILGSETYRLAADATAKTNVSDSANVFLWRGARNRLDVEAWRDALLAVSGNLDATLGGPTFELKDANSKRRTVYAKVSRHELDGLLRMFDFPDANVTADKRNSTTVPQQQLFALNSEFMVIQAKAFATRVEKSGKTDAERITAAYRLAYQRLPEAREIELAERYLKIPTKADDKLTRWQQYAQALLASNEFLYVD